MQNREELRQKGHDRRQKNEISQKGETISFSEEGINIAF
jgi:hypothetical protein